MEVKKPQILLQVTVSTATVAVIVAVIVSLEAPL